MADQHNASRVMNDMRWAWSINESFHFIGVTLLFGVIGLYDLRLLGLLEADADARAPQADSMGRFRLLPERADRL